MTPSPVWEAAQQTQIFVNECRVFWSWEQLGAAGEYSWRREGGNQWCGGWEGHVGETSPDLHFCRGKSSADSKALSRGAENSHWGTIIKAKSAMTGPSIKQWCVCACCVTSVMFNSVWPYGPDSCQTLLSTGFSRQEKWSGLPCPPPGNLPDPGTEPASPALQTDSLLS